MRFRRHVHSIFGRPRGIAQCFLDILGLEVRIIFQDLLTCAVAYNIRRGRYWIASATCRASIRSLPARSAMVRASFRMRAMVCHRHTPARSAPPRGAETCPIRPPHSARVPRRGPHSHLCCAPAQVPPDTGIYDRCIGVAPCGDLRHAIFVPRKRSRCTTRAAPLDSARGLRSTRARICSLGCLRHRAVGGQLVQGSKSPSSRGTWMWMSARKVRRAAVDQRA